MIDLNVPITSLRMIGPVYSQRLKKLEVETVGDLLYHIPSRYEDFSLISKIALLQAGEKVTIVGVVKSIKNIYTKHGKKIQKGTIGDETGEIEIIWYNQPFLVNILRAGMKVTLAGKVDWFGNRLVMESPDYEIVKEKMSFIHTGRLVPVYPETAGVSSKWLRSRIANILFKFSPDIKEFLPENIIKTFGLISEKEAVYKIHFPNNHSESLSAKRRLSFDELLIMELAAQVRKKSWQEKKVKKRWQIASFLPEIKKFIVNLPFELTSAQKRAVKEILADLSRDIPMNRLLEGDVGSGKTVVAAVAIYAGYLNGKFSALMAPTEILANQHFQTLEKLLSPYHVKVGLLTGSKKWKDEKPHVLVGTHALISSEDKITGLDLVIIDEQQRFGVEQRAKLKNKGDNPHLLSMTATPIPRTIALTLYADLDLSVIDQLPKGRIPVKTWVVPPQKRQAAYEWIRGKINQSEQAFIVCPFIEESETMNSVKAAKAEFERLKKQVFPEFKLDLLHGNLPEKEKNRILADFKENEINILVATPVVEVGIDIPKATIMMIEAADRFGLAQLHQLRGRVGRSNLPSYCLLFTESDKTQTLKRLKMLEKVYSGPKLAELDLKIRGSGEIYGTKQHGNFNLKIADFSDVGLIKESKKAVSMIMASDSSLEQLPLLREKLKRYTIKPISND